MLGTRFSLIFGTRWWFSLLVGTQFSILGTRIGSLKRLKKLVFAKVTQSNQAAHILIRY